MRRKSECSADCVIHISIQRKTVLLFGDHILLRRTLRLNTLPSLVATTVEAKAITVMTAMNLDEFSLDLWRILLLLETCYPESSRTGIMITYQSKNIIMRQNRTGEQRTPFQDGTKERETENMKKILEKEGQMETTRVMEAVGPGLIMVTIEMVIVGMEMADTIIQEAILSIKGIRDMVIDARHLFILNL